MTRPLIAAIALTASLALSMPAGAQEPAGDEPEQSGCGFVFAADAPALALPCEMAVDAWDVIECESRWDTNAVGALGERGLLQVHPIHLSGMAKMGLDFEQESDRMVFAVAMYGWRGWAPWSCAP